MAATDDSTSAPQQFIYYRYNPSLAAAVIFLVLFAITTVIHIFQLGRKRTWYFLPFVIGGIFEVIGYAGRAISAHQTPNWAEGPYIIQSLFILLAPALFAASIYMVLGRIILLIDGEEHSLIRANWLTKLFVLGDVLSFLAQAGGGGILASSKTTSNVKLGQNIITGGLAIQVLFFGFFVIVAGTFHRRMKIAPTATSMSPNIPWEKYLTALYIVSLCILIRSVFRVAEYVLGQDGYLLTHEAFSYIFDATLMFIAMAIYNVLHPGNIIFKERYGHNERIMSQDSGYALEEQGRGVRKP